MKIIQLDAIKTNKHILTHVKLHIQNKQLRTYHTPITNLLSTIKHLLATY